MKLTLLHGAAHTRPHTTIARSHTVRMRVRGGLGTESLDGRPPEDTIWPAGALEYLPPEAEHTHTTDVETDWIVLELDGDEWKQAAEAFTLPTEPVSCSAGPVMRDGHLLARSVYRHVAASVSFLDTYEQNVHASTVADTFFHALAGDQDHRQPSWLTPQTIRQIAAHVDEHPHTTLEQLAQVASLSRFYFISAFRRTTGSTPYQFIISRRLMKARLLLKQESRTITDIAYDCGFASHAHLSATFSRWFGIPPTNYRKLMSEHDKQQVKKRTISQAVDI